MVFTADDKQLIKSLKATVHEGFLKEFPQKNWKSRELDYLLSNIDKHGTTVRVPSNVQPRSARTSGNTIAKWIRLIVKQITDFQ